MRGRPAILTLLLLAAGASLACSGRNEPPPGFENDAPVAQAGPDQSGSAGEELFFDGSASTDLDGEIVAYLWNFGDGAEAAGVVVSHTFADGGNYLVTLTVTDDRDAEDSDQALVAIADPVPVAVAAFPGNVHVGESIAFDASGSSAAAAISAWRWSFGDGSTATGETVNHVYDRSGNFTVRLTVEDIEARSGDWSGPIEVFPIDIDGIYDLTPSPNTFACARYTAALEDTVLTVTVTDAAGNVTAQGSTGHDWAGTISGTSLSLTSSYIAPTGGGCINAPVTATLTGTFAADGSFSGNVLAYYDLGANNCQCSAAFPVTGTPR